MSDPNHNILRDQAERDLIIHGLGTNLLVEAAAGTGKDVQHGLAHGGAGGHRRVHGGADGRCDVYPQGRR